MNKATKTPFFIAIAVALTTNLLGMNVFAADVMPAVGNPVSPAPGGSSLGSPAMNSPGIITPGIGSPSISSPGVAPAVASPASAANLPDMTDKLRMIPGTRVVYDVHDGLDTRWKKIGDYQFSASVEKPIQDYAYTFRWTMSEPADASGIRSVAREDLQSAHKVSLFYPNKESCCLTGFTNILRVSDDLYRHLKRNTRTPFELDGPDVQMVYHHESVAMPHWIQSAGTEMVDVVVNEMPAQVRAIKAETSNGWHYWVMDNPKWPLIVKADAPFRWDPPSFTAVIAGGALPGPSGVREGKRIVDDLKLHGTATSHMILFAFDSDVLKPQSKTILNAVATYLKQNASVRLGVEGHCDNVGGHEYNMKLSLRRANSVKRYLVQSGVGAGRLQANGFGFTKPIADNKTALGRAQNRRVVFKRL